ncbi:1-deoxy-D-xylulose-5-phosphate reductoisomerase [Massilioclostridium coli]|uniref:1-deoxy-D-xylulose-5-phosphate reductoisomerase n=1 Tax=Massilioclostridium coli TaxID=1870991 RepID=UPI000D7AD34C|nr:1-deoxy-D-xylulose-5-phosphate reductoisomerase [Massilioclostridium coli]PWN00115.1 MAG: 1-deoxy-D-xylulose-5-phosphate reductoisomerase [Massilioclostridium sp.]
MKRISILGSTGSIGTQALDVVKKQGFQVVALAAKSNYHQLANQVREYHPSLVCIYEEEYLVPLQKELDGMEVQIVTGMEGLCQAATVPGAEMVLNSVVGMIGLRPTLEAIYAHKDIALANKETLVTGGELVMKAVKEYGVNLYPVDSEHSAIFQSLQGNKIEQVSKILLTASGGPFFGKTKQELVHVGLQDALNHPNWSMGKKITIDSATLMNKGLELIEAVWLFQQKPENIEIVVQRESVVHSAVEYVDGSVIAQLGTPDMKIPIQYAFTYPERVDCDVKRLSLFDYGTLSFYRPDYETFDCLTACKEAISRGGLYPTLVNGANEKAVELFLQEKISFLQIGEVVKQALELSLPYQEVTLEHILQADQAAREFVTQYFHL